MVMTDRSNFHLGRPSCSDGTLNLIIRYFSMNEIVVSPDTRIHDLVRVNEDEEEEEVGWLSGCERRTKRRAGAVDFRRLGGGRDARNASSAAYDDDEDDNIMNVS